jgi:hypothetical protein
MQPHLNKLSVNIKSIQKMKLNKNANYFINIKLIKKVLNKKPN